MKQIFLILVLFILSCEKDEPKPAYYCWKCNIVTTYTTTGFQPVTKNDSITKCNFTVQDINNYISIKTDPIKIITNGGLITTTIISKYDCKKR